MRVSEGKGKIHATDCQSSKESEERAGGLSQVRQAAQRVSLEIGN